MSDGIDVMYDVMLSRFMKINSESELPDDDLTHLNKIAKSLGYLAQTNSAITHTIKHEQRLTILEEKFKNNQPLFNMQMFESESL